VGEAEIGYLFTRMVTTEFILLIMPHLFQRLVKKGRAVMDLANACVAHPFMIMLVGSSPDEVAYQEAVLHRIVDSVGGIAMDMGKIEPARRLMGNNMLRCTIFATVFRFGNMFATNLDGNEATDSQYDWTHAMQGPKESYIRSGQMIDDGGENPYIIHYENNLYGHCETIYFYDQRIRKHREALDPLGFDTALAAIEQCNVPLAAFDPVARKFLSPLACDFNEWQKRISAAFDPGGVSDTGLYTDEKDPDWERVSPEKKERLKALQERFGRKG